MSKAVSPVVAIALLLVTVVGAAVGFQGWFNTYSSSVLADVENRDTISTALSISSLSGNFLYVKAGQEENLSYLSIRDSSGNILCEYDTYYSEPLVGHWAFDDLSGSTSTDSSGYGNDGTFMNGSFLGPGVLSSAAHFTGFNYFIITSDTSFHTQGPVTMTSWLNLDEFTPSGMFIRNGPNADLQYSLYIRNNTLSFQYYESSFKSVTLTNFTDMTPLSTWIHVASTINGTDVRFFIDGDEVGNGTASSTTDAAGEDLLLGAHENPAVSYGQGQRIIGYLDEVMIFNTSLTSSQISNIYNFNSLNLTLSDGINKIAVPGCGILRGNKYDIFMYTNTTSSQATLVAK